MYILGPYLRPYGQEAYFPLCLSDANGDRVTPIAEVGDVTLNKDEQQSQVTYDTFAANNGGVVVPLTIAEMECARGVIYIYDQTTPKAWVDTAVLFETYGHNLSQHPNIGKPPVA